MQPGGLLVTQAEGSIWGRPIAIRDQPTNPYNSNISTAVTIKSMRYLAHQYARHPAVVRAVAEALQGGAESQREVACAIFQWIRVNIQFIEDEYILYEHLGVDPENLDQELLIPPPALLGMPAPFGDCDDFTLLTAAMLLCVGITPYFVTVATDPNDPEKLSHVYACAKLADEQELLCLDSGNRLPMVEPGWESSDVTRKAVWRV